MWTISGALLDQFVIHFGEVLQTCFSIPVSLHERQPSLAISCESCLTHYQSESKCHTMCRSRKERRNIQKMQNKSQGWPTTPLINKWGIGIGHEVDTRLRQCWLKVGTMSAQSPQNNVGAMSSPRRRNVRTMSAQILQLWRSQRLKICLTFFLDLSLYTLCIRVQYESIYRSSIQQVSLSSILSRLRIHLEPLC